MRLAEIFYKFGWMEKAGSGFPESINAYQNLGVQPVFSAEGRSFVIELPRVGHETNLEKAILTALSSAASGLSRAQLQDKLQVCPTISLYLTNAA